MLAERGSSRDPRGTLYVHCPSHESRDRIGAHRGYRSHLNLLQHPSEELLNDEARYGGADISDYALVLFCPGRRGLRVCMCVVVFSFYSVAVFFFLSFSYGARWEPFPSASLPTFVIKRLSATKARAGISPKGSLFSGSAFEGDAPFLPE